MTIREDPLRRKGFPLYPPATDGSGHQQSASRVPARVPEGLALDARRDRHRRPFLRGPRFFLAPYLLPLSLALALSVLDPRHARRETRRAALRARCGALPIRLWEGSSMSPWRTSTAQAKKGAPTGAPTTHHRAEPQRRTTEPPEPTGPREGRAPERTPQTPRTPSHPRTSTETPQETATRRPDTAPEGAPPARPQERETRPAQPSAGRTPHGRSPTDRRRPRTRWPGGTPNEPRHPPPQHTPRRRERPEEPPHTPPGPRRKAGPRKPGSPRTRPPTRRRGTPPDYAREPRHASRRHTGENARASTGSTRPGAAGANRAEKSAGSYPGISEYRGYCAPGDSRHPRERHANDAAGESGAPGNEDARTNAAATTGATPARRRDRNTRHREGTPERPAAERAANTPATRSTSHRDDADAHRRDRNTDTADDQTDIPPTPKE